MSKMILKFNSRLERQTSTMAGRSKVFLFPFIFAFLLVVNVDGQNTNANTAQNTNENSAVNQTIPANTTSNQTQKKETDYHDSVVVTQVYNLQYKTATTAAEKEYKRKAGLNDIIVVRVQNLERLFNISQCVGENLPAPCVPKNISLFIDGREMAGIQPESGAPKLDTVSANANQNAQPTVSADGELRYHLQRTDGAKEGSSNSEHWADLLGLRFDDFEDWKFNVRERRVEISVGLAGDYPVATKIKIEAAEDENRFWLYRVRFQRLLLWGLIAAIIIGGLVVLAIKTNILRDSREVLWNQEKPYSLSAVQAAWWFVLVFLSFIFIWLVTGQYDLSPTALILLSIGSGTALGAKIIDNNKQNRAADDSIASPVTLNLLVEQKEAIEAELTALEKSRPKDAAALAERRQEYKDKIGEIRQDFPYAVGQEKRGFLMDILSDVDGVNFHRFQLIVWTIILGLFFVISSLGRLAMTQFSETLLALMGISAGTYLGFKIPEKNHTTAPVKMPPDEKIKNTVADAQTPPAAQKTKPADKKYSL